MFNFFPTNCPFSSVQKAPKGYGAVRVQALAYLLGFENLANVGSKTPPPPPNVIICMFFFAFVFG
jgi:hypothetical protein